MNIRQPSRRTALADVVLFVPHRLAALRAAVVPRLRFGWPRWPVWQQPAPTAARAPRQTGGVSAEPAGNGTPASLEPIDMAGAVPRARASGGGGVRDHRAHSQTPLGISAADVREKVIARARSGAAVGEIEQEVIAPSALDEEEQAALWLLAWGHARKRQTTIAPSSWP
jgi:hypothetical protein